jgi:hypothetical protein
VFLLEYPLKEEYVMIMIVCVRFLVRVWSNSGGRVVGCWGEGWRIRCVRLGLDPSVLGRIILGL